MTPYNVHGNVAISQSEIDQDCPAQLESNVVRNHGVYFSTNHSIRMPDPAGICDAMDISGNATLIHTKTSTSGAFRAGPVLRNGDYIYIVHVSGSTISGKTLEIKEYKISTQTTSTIEVATSTDPTTIPGSYTKMTLIEDRKLLVFDRYLQDTLEAQKVWIIDFEADTSVNTLTIPARGGLHNCWYPDYLVSAKNNSGDIILVIQGNYYYDDGEWSQMAYHGIYTYYKNYTQEGEWAVDYQTHLGIGYECDSVLYLPPTAVGTDCLVTLANAYPNDGDPLDVGMVAYRFDLNTLTMTKGSYLEGCGDEPWPYFIAPENSGNCLYGVVDVWNVDYCTRIFRIDASTLAFSIVYTCPDWDEIFFFSDREHVYFYDSDEDEMYDAATQTLLGSFGTIPHGYWGYLRSTILDDSGCVLYWKTDDNTIRAIELDGDAVDSWTPSVQDYTYTRIDHLGNCLLVVVDTYTSPNTVYYYLVT